MFHQRNLHKAKPTHSADGKHLLLELDGCNPEILNNARTIDSILTEAVRLSGATVVNKCYHHFKPQGVTGVLILEESHLSIHTWPESGRAAIDMYTCGECFPENAKDYLVGMFEATVSHSMLVKRGMAMEVVGERTLSFGGGGKC